ncbi:cell wall protein AWA1 [Drosophila eugracilis]|uniref:cell wall protein AWA1 n=1 Tax=Drosophila eugracilis TaxID=29029 RepID=UPI0007E6C4F1|nr:cell wall protein AWA1 [Drosophila eugracilis]
MANGSATEAAATATPQQRIAQAAQQALLPEVTVSSKENASSALGVTDLVADVCIHGRGADYSSMRSSTSTSGAGSGAASSSSSSFSFKHFLSSTGTVTAPTSTVTSAAVQTSTGARPKVPQSASASHMQPPDVNGSSASSRMKRSPRFSSFDSQASLAEYASCAGACASTSSGGSQHRLRPDLRLSHDAVQDALDNDDDDHVALAQMRNTGRHYDERIDDDIFPSAASNQQPALSTRYVPRSYSNYEMPCPSTSPRRRPTGNRDQRPTRLVLSTGPKMKLDLPLESCNAASGGAGPGVAAASGLPDFVQDHLPDAWCAGQDALSSPPNSPLGGAEESNGAVGLLPSSLALRGPLSAALPGPPGDPSTSSTVKMLPDFLSDGPIIHSSQRLADVAIGLPSNSIDSPPQEAVGALQLSTLRQENERLQRELQEARAELNVQTRRASDFEQQLLQLSETARRREALATTNTQTTQHLRRQLAQLESELSTLRGSGGSDCAAGGVPVTTPGSEGSGISSIRPSRTHHLSRDLLRAADTAEQNLRQLLTGVDNLRQMAANLEQPAQPTTTPRSPDLYTDFN